MKRNAFFLTIVIILCVVFVCPLNLPQLVSEVRTAKEANTHAAWKTEAAKSGASLYSYEDNLYYAQTPEENIIPIGKSLAFVNNEVIIYFKDGTSVEKKQELIDALDAQVVGCAAILNKYQLRLSDKKSFLSLQKLCTELCQNKNVAFAGCNLAKHLTEDAVPDDPWTEPDEEYSAAYNWDESKIDGGNWWLKATQTVSAWDYAEYFHPIRIGVLDGGFETNHEDLQNKIKYPSKFYERTNRPSSHGTHVAGIISANANNKIGITGICNQADLMCVDWSPEEKVQYWSTDERIFTGVIALVKSGAKVINLSLGAASAFEEKNAFSWNFSMNFEGIMFSFMTASLLARGYDFLVVQSAGNGSKADVPCDSFYNGSFCSVTLKNAFTGWTRISKQDVLNHIIIVGSCTSAHNKTKFYQSSFSNYGGNVSIFAPGSWVFSTDLTEKGGYSYKSGTSMAAPVVTGIAAMTWSVNPELTGAQVKKIICDPQNTIYTCENYYNDTMDIPSYPMINAKLSVEAALHTLPNADEIFASQDFPQTQSGGQIPQIGVSDQKTIEQFRGEIGE